MDAARHKASLKASIVDTHGPMTKVWTDEGLRDLAIYIGLNGGSTLIENVLDCLYHDINEGICSSIKKYHHNRPMDILQCYERIAALCCEPDHVLLLINWKWDSLYAPIIVRYRLEIGI